MRYSKIFSFKMETMEIVEVVRKLLQSWEEMRKRMLAEREENQNEIDREGEKGEVLK